MICDTCHVLVFSSGALLADVGTCHRSRYIYCICYYYLVDILVYLNCIKGMHKFIVPVCSGNE